MKERFFVNPALLLRILQKGLDFRSEHDASIMDAVIERLDSDPVARQPELLRAFIPKREREHPAQTVETLDAPLGKRMQDHLGIGMVGRPGALTELRQLLAQL